METVLVSSGGMDVVDGMLGGMVSVKVSVKVFSECVNVITMADTVEDTESEDAELADAPLELLVGRTVFSELVKRVDSPWLVDVLPVVASEDDAGVAVEKCPRIRLQIRGIPERVAVLVTTTCVKLSTAVVVRVCFAVWIQVTDSSSQGSTNFTIRCLRAHGSGLHGVSSMMTTSSCLR